jgi:signal transduction histidine kinase
LPIGPNVNVALVAEEDSELLLSLTDSAASMLFLSTLSVSLAAMLALLGFAAWLAWRIRRLSQASRILVAQDERFISDLPESAATDELGDLSRDLTRLLARVGEYNAYLKGLGGKLTHELRTPLTIVATSLENLQADTDRERSQIYLGRARQGIERMQAMVTALGAASRVEEAVVAAEMETFDLAALVTELTAAYRESHPQRCIDVQVAASPCPVLGAPELVAQMLDKLLDNALDFCPAEGTISIGLEARTDRYILGVRNSGSRLPAGREERLFDSMFSARDADSGPAHLGLGLHIVQLIAHHHDGTVVARNLPDHKGVGVFVTFKRPVTGSA